jgi:hypothetical protein
MGQPYPLALLTTVLMRLGTDKELSALRVAILKAVITRNFDSEVPVSLDRTNKNPGYLLGRLLATYANMRRHRPLEVSKPQLVVNITAQRRPRHGACFLD